MRERSPLVAAVAGVLLAVGCDAAGLSGPASNGPTFEVTRGPLSQTMLLTGELEAANSVELVTPRTDNWNLAIRWMSDEGSVVAEGDKVVEFDNSAIMEKIADHELAMVTAGIELASARAEQAVTVAEKRFEVDQKQTELDKAELDATVPVELLSRREHRDSELALRRAKVALSTAEDDLRAATKGGDVDEEVKRIAYVKAERQYETSVEQIDALTLTAPRAGVVEVSAHPWEGRDFQVGDNAWPGMAVAKLPDLDKMLVKATLSDVDEGRVRVGMSATCYVDAYVDRPFAAKVISVNPVARETSQQATRRFFFATLELEETDADIMRPGLSVKVEIHASTREDLLLVPRAALDLSADVPRAARAEGESLEVDVGECNAQVCEVLSGLAEGDRLRRPEGAR
jgi:multidrug efflux pump subunit AcrA (membrane-fusion protein)